VQIYQINRSGIVERYIVFKTSIIWFNKTTHRKGHRLSTKWVLASGQSSVRSWPVQPIKELSSAAGLCARRVCALIRQLAI